MEIFRKITTRLRRTGSDRIRADGRIRRRVCGRLFTQHRNQHQFHLFASWFRRRSCRKLAVLAPAPPSLRLTERALLYHPRLHLTSVPSPAPKPHSTALVPPTPLPRSLIDRCRIAEFLPQRPEFVSLDHEPHRVTRAPHDFGPGNQFQPAAVLQNCRPAHGYIHPCTRRRSPHTPQTHSSAADIQGLRPDRLIPLVRLQNRVPRFPPKRKSSRSTALVIHNPMMTYTRIRNNRQEVSIESGTGVLFRHSDPLRNRR